jgi:hypothetical protein
MSVVSVLNALLTPLIAIITTFIAWRQWKGTELKLNLERYERRLRIYEEVFKMLTTICGDAKPTWEDLLKFRVATAEADFLFGPEIPKYLDEIFSRGMKLRQANLEYRDFTQQVPQEYDHDKVVQELSSQLKWLTEQALTAKDKFKKYLNISG